MLIETLVFNGDQGGNEIGINPVNIRRHAPAPVFHRKCPQRQFITVGDHTGNNRCPIQRWREQVIEQTHTNTAQNQSKSDSCRAPGQYLP